MVNLILSVINVILLSISLVLIYFVNVFYSEIQDLKECNEILLNKIAILENKQKEESWFSRNILLSILGISTILFLIYGAKGGSGDISDISDLMLASSDRITTHFNEHSSSVHEHLTRVSDRTIHNTSSILQNVQEVLRVVSRLDVLIRFGRLFKKPLSGSSEVKENVRVYETNDDTELIIREPEELCSLSENSFEFI